MTTNSELQPWFLFIFIPAFIAFWCVICYFLNYQSGWLMMNRKFAKQEPFVGDKSYFNSGRIGPTCFRGILTIGISNEGLYLSMPRIWAVGAKPLLIPWKYLYSARKQKIFFSDYVTIDVDNPKITTIQIPWKFINKLPLKIKNGDNEHS